MSNREKTNRGWLNSFFHILWEESDKTYGTVEIALAVIPFILNGVINIEIIEPFLSTIGMVILVSLINEGWWTWYVIVGAIGVIWPLARRAMKSDPWYLPALKITFESTQEFIAETSHGPFPAKYVKALVERSYPGKSLNCKAIIHSVEKHENDGKFYPTDYTDQYYLQWSILEGDTREIVDISYGIRAYVAIFSTDPLKNKITPRTKTHINRYEKLFDDTAVYRLTIRIIADESAPIDLILIVDWRGKWNTFAVYKEGSN
ncbi:MAG: hypothetical protein LLH30_05070 [Candidatus Manganitrophus sp. SA1]|nr:hypothetical protein [Candidatus Manganitrophus morganii]